MATDWAADVKKYAANADDGVIAAIVRYCGIALRNRDSSLVSFSDPTELARVRTNYLQKKLGLTQADSVLDAAIAKVGDIMKADRTKNRVTVYYLLAAEFGKLGLFAPKGKVAAAAPVAKAPAAKKAAAPAKAPAAKAPAAKASAAKATTAKAAATKAPAKTAAPAKAKPAAKTAKVAGAAAAGAAGVAALASMNGAKSAKPAAKKPAAKKPAAQAAPAKAAPVKAAAAKPAPKPAPAPVAAPATAPAPVAAPAPAPAPAPVAKAAEIPAATAAVAAPVAAAAVAATAATASAAAKPAAAVQRALAEDEGNEGGLGWLWWLIGLGLLTFAAWWLFGRAKPDESAAAATATEAAAVVDASAAAVTDLAAAPAEGTVTIPTGAGVTSETRDSKPVVKVYFDSGKTDVAPAFAGAAGGLKAWLDGHAGSTLQVSGYNDPTGNAAQNAELSKNRAQAVAAELVKAGIPESAVALVKPEATTDTAVAKEAARRVEVTVK